jgi:4-amino-4-deoxy-L-arabinose transferase-like glycosyltransferase
VRHATCIERLRRSFAQIERWIPLLLPAAVGALALCLRVHALGRESLWLDEGFTWQRARLPVPELIADAIGAHHNPSYFLLLHYWVQFGDDEYMLRFPSALAGALTAAAGCVLGRVLAGSAAGFVTGMLVALAPVHVLFGQEARMYAPLSATATIAMTALIWLGVHAEAAALPIFGTRRLHRLWLGTPGVLSPPSAAGAADLQPLAAGTAARPPYGIWAAYIAGTIGTLYLHNTAVVFGATLAIAGAALLIHPFRMRLGFAINFVAANLIVLVGFGLYLRTELAQAERFSNEAFWMDFPSPKDLIGFAREIYLLTAPWPSPLAVLLLMAVALGVFRLRRRPEVALAVVCLAIGGALLLLLVSTYKPMFGTRFMLWATVPFFALVGAGVAQRRPWIFALAFVLGVGWLVRPQLERDYRELTKEPWREVMWTIRSRAQPRSRIMTATWEEASILEYYMQRRSYPFDSIPVTVRRRRNAWKQVGDATRVWIIDRKDGRRFKRLKRGLEQRGQLGWERSWLGIRVVEFDFARN